VRYRWSVGPTSRTTSSTEAEASGSELDHIAGDDETDDLAREEPRASGCIVAPDALADPVQDLARDESHQHDEVRRRRSPTQQGDAARAEGRRVPRRDDEADESRAGIRRVTVERLRHEPRGVGGDVHGRGEQLDFVPK
jgi:hypothetical protein